MPRKARIQYPGAICRVMSRGGRRESIFLDDVDRYDFQKTPSEACQKTSWQVHAKSDPAKLALAARLRRETILTVKQMAQRLSLGTTKSATTALHRWMRNAPQPITMNSPAQSQFGISVNFLREKERIG